MTMNQSKLLTKVKVALDADITDFNQEKLEKRVWKQGTSINWKTHFRLVLLPGFRIKVADARTRFRRHFYNYIEW